MFNAQLVRKIPPAQRTAKKPSRPRAWKPTPPRYVRRKMFCAPLVILSGWEVITHDWETDAVSTLFVTPRLHSALSYALKAAHRHSVASGGDVSMVETYSDGKSLFVIKNGFISASFFVRPHVIQE